MYESLYVHSPSMYSISYFLMYLMYIVPLHSFLSLDVLQVEFLYSRHERVFMLLLFIQFLLEATSDRAGQLC